MRLGTLRFGALGHVLPTVPLAPTDGLPVLVALEPCGPPTVEGRRPAPSESCAERVGQVERISTEKNVAASDSRKDNAGSLLFPTARHRDQEPRPIDRLDCKDLRENSSSPVTFSAERRVTSQGKGRTEVQPDSAQTSAWLEKLGRGDKSALGRLLAHHRDRVRAFVEVRLDDRIRARLDPSDVVQETQLEVIRRMDDYLRRRPMPFHLWVRKTAYQRLLDLRRDHRTRQRRSVDREVAFPQDSSLSLARPVLGRSSSPSSKLQARENADRIARSVAQLPDADREILLMRHVEALPYEEIACLLAIEPPAARKRYGRALIRLQKVLTENGVLE